VPQAGARRHEIGARLRLPGANWIWKLIGAAAAADIFLAANRLWSEKHRLGNIRRRLRRSLPKAERAGAGAARKERLTNRQAIDHLVWSVPLR